MAGDRPVNGDEWIRLGRQLADEIRTRRRAAGWSQPALAARIGYTPQYVSLAERPSRGLASESLVRAIDEALGAEGALLALRDQADSARKACRPGAAPSTVVEDVTAERGRHQSLESEEVKASKRRELITLSAAIAFGGHLEEPAARILAAADEPQVPARVRTGDVRHLRSAWEALVNGSVTQGGGAVRHHALAALRRATAMLKSSSTPEVYRETAVMAAKIADTAAWTAFDAGHPESARQLSLLGLKSAHESGDLGMRACVASGMARREIHRGNWKNGLELTQLAFTAGDALTPNAVADLHTVRALAFARKHDTSQCRRYRAAAVETYRPDSVANDPFWLDFTPAQLDRDLAFATYDLAVNDPSAENSAERLALIDGLSTAFRQYPADWVLFRAIIVTRLATLLYMEGEQRVASRRAEEVITLAEQVRSARLPDDLRVLLRALPPGDRADEDTRDLRHRLSTTLTDMA